MRSRLFTLFCILAMLLGLVAAAAAQRNVGEPRARSLAGRLAEPIELGSIDESLLSTAIFLVTNQRRAQHGLPSLAHHPRLTTMAANHARGSARLDELATAAGIRNPFVVENIRDGRAVRGQTYWSFAQLVVDEWMASSVERHNILNPNARQLGVAVHLSWRDSGWPFIKAVQEFQFFEDVQPRIGPAGGPMDRGDAVSTERRPAST